MDAELINPWNRPHAPSQAASADELALVAMMLRAEGGEAAARGYLAAKGRSPEEVDRIIAAARAAGGVK
jgi:hypothetical protein